MEVGRWGLGRLAECLCSALPKDGRAQEYFGGVFCPSGIMGGRACKLTALGHYGVMSLTWLVERDGSWY